MPIFKFTNDQTVQRLRWIMVAAILFSVCNTLAGQPAAFWHDPALAIRGDGLSIYNKTNHTFEFFLGRGWAPYLAANFVYGATAFLVVSILPRMAALMAIFSFIFAHCFGASNWLAVRWHLGVFGPAFYGIVLGAVLVFSVFPSPAAAEPVVKRLRWVMLGAMLFDEAITLFGQPASYWHHPETLHEANPLTRVFLAQGWMGYCILDPLWVFAIFKVISIIPKPTALICVFAYTFGGFIGPSNWLFYNWRLGMETPVIYGIILSAIIVPLAFSNCRRENQPKDAGFVTRVRDYVQASSLCWR